MACSSGCYDEALHFQEASPGPVLDSEDLCRGGYGPNMHYNKTGAIRRSLLRNSDLQNGSLSVWRTPHDDATTQEIEDLRIVLEEGPPGQVLWDIFAAQASEIRSLRVTIAPEVQAFHAYDDCRTDSSGGTNPRHAVLAICSYFEPGSLAVDDTLFVEIRDKLFDLFTRRTIWTSSEK